MKLFEYISIIILFFIVSIEARRLMVIRHGEKISDDYIGLNDKGKARAHCLYQIFNSHTSYGQPQSIYSNKRGNRSHRPYDTVKPLADRLGLQVKEFRKYEPEEFVKNTLNKDKSNIILLSSAREWIPSLIEAIGYKVDDDIDEFDNIWLIENDDKVGGGKVKIKKQNLDECINNYLSGKKSTTKKTTTKKTTTKKTTTKKTTTKNATTKNATTKKTTTKKTTKKVLSTVKSNNNIKKINTLITASSSNSYRCGASFGAICPKGLCCSKYNYCGSTREHCDVGCQPKYGICH